MESVESNVKATAKSKTAHTAAMNAVLVGYKRIGSLLISAPTIAVVLINNWFGARTTASN